MLRFLIISSLCFAHANLQCNQLEIVSNQCCADNSTQLLYDGVIEGHVVLKDPLLCIGDILTQIKELPAEDKNLLWEMVWEELRTDSEFEYESEMIISRVNSVCKNRLNSSLPLYTFLTLVDNIDKQLNSIFALGPRSNCLQSIIQYTSRLLQFSRKDILPEDDVLNRLMVRICKMIDVMDACSNYHLGYGLCVIRKLNEDVLDDLHSLMTHVRNNFWDMLFITSTTAVVHTLS